MFDKNSTIKNNAYLKIQSFFKILVKIMSLKNCVTRLPINGSFNLNNFTYLSGIQILFSNNSLRKRLFQVVNLDLIFKILLTEITSLCYDCVLITSKVVFFYPGNIMIAEGLFCTKLWFCWCCTSCYYTRCNLLW